MKQWLTYRWALLNTIGLMAVLYVNYLANAQPINGVTTGALSAEYPNLFVPAGLTFAVWGIIYLSLMVFVVAGWRIAAAAGETHPIVLDTIGPWFVVSCLGNIAWIYTWHYRLVLISVLVMVLLLVSLLILYSRLHRQVAPLKKKSILIPFSLYTSWINVALVANVTALLVHINWDGAGISPVLWTYIMMGAAAIISTLMILRYGDVFYGGVTLWALYGIFLKQSQSVHQYAANLQTCAWICMSLVAITMASVLLRCKLLENNFR